MNRTGFTLIELLIVVVIIGLLAAIAIPKFGNTKDKAYIASMKSDLRNLVTAEESYFADSIQYTNQTDCNTPTAPGFLAWCASSGNTLNQLNIAKGQKSGWTAQVSNANTAISCAIYVGQANPLKPAKNNDPEGVPICQ
jgi:prepilin-type N-terminal cleavage/methylation domain-containing protein